ncbi:hypothetical protein pclt_cds_399 [Pandoravirus celtis]|uniref:Uncharacterized protein n=1 Tax=Pandoravirus celtis TaxID=2568002 RepID=A0A4D6EGT2_9VIRU|nr:hypothetical protein pclt_cds_399 [Pandoravirus celtis]
MGDRGDERARPAKRARHGHTPDNTALPLEVRLPPELWSHVFAAVDDPAAAAAWRAASKTARRLFDTLPGHDPSCGGNRALYEACRRADEATVARLLGDRRVVVVLCRGGPNLHGSLFGHESVPIACRLLAAAASINGGSAHGPRITTRDVEAACLAARTSDAVPLLLLAAAPVRTHQNSVVPTIASVVGLTEACLDAAIAHRRPLLLRSLLAFVASHAFGDRGDYGDLPARAAVCAVRRRDAAMLRIVLDADGYRAPEAALALNHGDPVDDGQVDPLCEAVRYGWLEGVRLVSSHRRYLTPGPREPAALDGVQRIARAWCVALAYWMAVRMRRAEALKALTRSHRPTWCHPESPRATDALLAHGPTRTFVALVKTAPMARKVAQRAAATGHAVALGLALARVRRLCAGMPQGLFVRAVAKAAAAASSGRHGGDALNGPWTPVPAVDSDASDDRDPVVDRDDWAHVKHSGYLDHLPD